MAQEPALKRAVRAGWCVWHSDPARAKDRLVHHGLSEARARALARTLNERLGPVPGRPPWPFYYACHGNFLAEHMSRLNVEMDEEAEGPRRRRRRRKEQPA